MATAMVRTLPKKLTELGRIRIGNREANSNGKGTHPHKLDTFRLTSSNGSLLHYAALAYGGEVHPWESEGAPRDEHGRPQQFELYTTVNSMDVLIPTMSAASISFEQWSGSGCQRRCDGATIRECPLEPALEGTACRCPQNDRERASMAKSGKACARVLRLNVLLPDLPGMGTWRLECHDAFYATSEVIGTLEMLQMAGQAHTIIEAVLRLEQRMVKRPGKGEGKGTLKFAVPVLWPKYTPRQILAGAQQVLLAAPPTPTQPHALTETINVLYGEQEPGAAALVAQIDTLLAAQGMDPEQRKDWWGRMDQKYGGRTVFTLTMLLEKLQQKAATKRPEAGSPGIHPGEDTTQPDLMQAEEDAERERDADARQATLDLGHGNGS